MRTLKLDLNLEVTTQEEVEIVEAWETDVFFYSGGIDFGLHRALAKRIERRQKNKNVFFGLTTSGGSADEAYKLARFLKRTYEKVTIGVASYCKSAGTLVALGGHTVAMGPFGELGPLDVQLYRPDEIIQRSSGLTLSQALDFIKEKSYDTFEDIFLQIRRRSRGVITTKTASDIACTLTSGIYSAIAQSIDPNYLGDMKRSVEVAFEYGIRLGADEETVRHLVEGYPEHGFVIDLEEAEELFHDARAFDGLEELAIQAIRKASKEMYEIDCVASPSNQPIFVHVIVPTTPALIPEKSDETEGLPTSEAPQDAGNHGDSPSSPSAGESATVQNSARRGSERKSRDRNQNDGETAESSATDLQSNG